MARLNNEASSNPPEKSEPTGWKLENMRTKDFVAWGAAFAEAALLTQNEPGLKYAIFALATVAHAAERVHEKGGNFTHPLEVGKEIFEGIKQHPVWFFGALAAANLETSWAVINASLPHIGQGFHFAGEFISNTLASLKTTNNANPELGQNIDTALKGLGPLAQVITVGLVGTGALIGSFALGGRVVRRGEKTFNQIERGVQFARAASQVFFEMLHNGEIQLQFPVEIKWRGIFKDNTRY